MLAIECVSPSAVDQSDKIKGGIVLAKLKPTNTNDNNNNDNSALPGVLKCRYEKERKKGRERKRVG